ncbi:MAG: DUF3298 domain-containing protein [Flavobacteriia bacterium]|nr:DUF3298 domain-containing protein [Flavobacteriia bacterium]
MKSSFYLLLFIALFSACTSSENKKSSSTVENTTSIHQTKVYFGSIGKYPITMELTIDDETLTAKYVYNNKCETIKLKGEILDGNLTLSGGKECFEGKLDSTSITGTWSNGKKKFQFKLEERDIPFFSVSYKTLKKENCKYANETRKHITDSTNYWDTLCTSIDIQLMSFIFTDKSLEQKINSFIEKEVCEFGKGFDDNLSFKTIQQLLNSVNKQNDEFGYEHSISCNLIERFENILTFSISDYSYGFGAAHPNHFSVMYNIDLKTGKLIQLEDLFKKGTKYQLDRIAEKLFTKENGSEFWNFEQGQFELNSDFIIQKDGLLFTYDAYEIGSYAAGDPSVFIPFSKIKKLLKSESVLKEFGIEF